MGKLIAFGGQLTAGKDAAADHLVRKGWVKIGMSDVLHEALMTLNPIIGTQPVYDGVVATGEQTLRYKQHVTQYGYTEAKKHPEVRKLLQRFGTEVGRNMFGEDFWVGQIARRIDTLMEGGKAVTITGIRYPNELDMIEDFDGAAVWVTRPGLTVQSGHTSEGSLDPVQFQYELVNDGSLEDLGVKVEDVEASHYGDLT
jgi:hypothetical protein